MPDSHNAPASYGNDAWTLEDTFGIANTGDQVARMALTAPTPFSIAVNGKWGAGKTSILRRAFATLGGKPLEQAVPLQQQRYPEIPVTETAQWEQWHYAKQSSWADLKALAQHSFAVWYSPWQHQNADNPLIPLLLEIQAQYKTHFAWAQINRRGGVAGLALLENVIDLSANLLGGYRGKLVGGTVEAVKKAWQEVETDLTQLSDGQRFHLLFEDAVSFLLKNLQHTDPPKDTLIEQARLIIFIDDLEA